MTTIAVVIATFNGAATLDACLDSLEQQALRPSEIVVIDGASQDQTVSMLERRQHLLTHWRSEPDNGIYDAWNKALPHLSSDWVWFLGCDDELADRRVMTDLGEFLARLPDSIGIAYGKVAMVSASGRVTEVLGKPWEQTKKRMSSTMAIPHTGMVARRKLFTQIGGFDPQYRIAGDFEWTLRALDQTTACFIDRLLVRAGDAGVSGASSTQVRTLREFVAVCAARGRRPTHQLRWLIVRAQAKRWLLERFGSAVQSALVDTYRVATLRRPRRTSR